MKRATLKQVSVGFYQKIQNGFPLEPAQHDKSRGGNDKKDSVSYAVFVSSCLRG
jgi:hypothetical protein